MIIEPFNRCRDLKALETLYLNTRIQTFTWQPPNTFRRSDFQQDTQGEAILVVRAETVLGFASVWEPETFLHHLYICPTQQGLGLGSALLNAAIERFGSPMRLKCLKQNLLAYHFYLKHGWLVINESTGQDGEYFEMLFSKECL